jgi:ammonia channel protein AmtB
VDLITPLRVDEHHEQLGLDLSQHGETISLLDFDDARS